MPTSRSYPGHLVQFCEKKAFYLLFFFCYFFLKKMQLFIKVLHFFSIQLSAQLSAQSFIIQYFGSSKSPALNNANVKTSHRCIFLIPRPYSPHCCPAIRKTLENFPSNSKALSWSLHSWVAGDSLLLHSGNGRLTVIFNKIFHNFEK